MEYLPLLHRFFIDLQHNARRSYKSFTFVSRDHEKENSV